MTNKPKRRLQAVNSVSVVYFHECERNQFSDVPNHNIIYLKNSSYWNVHLWPIICIYRDKVWTHSAHFGFMLIKHIFLGEVWMKCSGVPPKSMSKKSVANCVESCHIAQAAVGSIVWTFRSSKSQGDGRWAPAATRFIAYGPKFFLFQVKSFMDFSRHIWIFETIPLKMIRRKSYIEYIKLLPWNSRREFHHRWHFRQVGWADMTRIYAMRRRLISSLCAWRRASNGSRKLCTSSTRSHQCPLVSPSLSIPSR